MAKYLGLHAVGSDALFRSWWDKLLFVLLTASFVLGSAYICFLIYHKICKIWKAKRSASPIPAPVSRYFADLNSHSQYLRELKSHKAQPKTFGVFLGSVSALPTALRAKLLTQWDLLILDPFQSGTLEAISAESVSPQLLARLDVSSVVKTERSSSNDEVIHSLMAVFHSIGTDLKTQHETQSHFTGVLLANWQVHFSPSVMSGVIQHVKSMGFDVYLELSSPDFLSEDDGRSINLGLISGIVCRNGTILANGDRRNYYDMAALRSAQRAIAAQPSPNGTTVMLWETINDGVEVSHDVVKRSFNWCRFNSAISWIGSEAALTDFNLAATETVEGEPLGALMWLKDEQVMKSHDTWRLNNQICRESAGNEAIYTSLQSFIPDLDVKLAFPNTSTQGQEENQAAEIHTLAPAPRSHHAKVDPLDISNRDEDYTGLGCFQIGLECSSKDFIALVEQQRRLRESKLLKEIKLTELQSLGAALQRLRDQIHTLYRLSSSPASTARVSRAFKELCEIINNNSDDDDRLRIYSGLHSGFRTSLDVQFWGIYELDGFSNTTIYVSAKTQDLAGTVLHTFLSSRKCTRAQCFMVETILSEQANSQVERWELPLRLVQDVEQLSALETMLLVQRLASSSKTNKSGLEERLAAICEYQLIDTPSLARLRALNSTTYLRGEVSAEELVTSRFAWYAKQSCQHPELPVAIALFKEIDVRMKAVFMDRQNEVLLQLEAALREGLKKGHIDAAVDFLALSVFCACRKLALGEVYLEILDRNPLPNPHSDQAACYAEMFATGSRCENYFDMTPNVLGKILSDRYQAYYKIHQPPMRDDNSSELPTAYASKLADVDPEAGAEEPSIYYRVAFLGIFAVPALIDILLLTTIGRGLYLTAFMNELERNMATIALMVALFLCGGIGTWISAGASYYLHSMAFPAMNMFVLTRFIAGLAVCTASGIAALIIVAIIKGIYAGIIFLLYFIILTTYLTLLATLATYQLPGFMFQSGRMVIVVCIPILFVSPLLTLWFGHDVLIYLCVLALFLGSLLVGARKVLSQWSTWYLKIPCVTDIEVINWYIETESKNHPNSTPVDKAELATSSLPRKALLAAVLEERNRRFWKKPTEDQIVKKLADQYEATNLLMNWYCKYTRAKMPFTYSVTWNLQCNAGIDTLKEIQKGLKLHNAFMHWRHNGDEVWCGVLYFVIALMDKWVALITGGTIVGLSAANSATFRLSVGFGLASYLVSAVFLDGIAQPLWATANKNAPRTVKSLKSLRDVAIEDARARRKLYWTTLVKFSIMHFYGIAITATLMWSFEGSRDAVIMYLAYMGAYIGLLWYQYNRIFTGALALYDLLIAAVLGLLVGPILHHYAPHFDFWGVIALAVSTWTTALLSIRTAKVGWPKFKEDCDETKSVSVPVYHYSSIPGCTAAFSRNFLAETYNSASAVSEEFRFRVTPSEHPGSQIMNILTSAKLQSQTSLVKDAFFSASEILDQAAKLWREGQIIIELVSARNIIQPEQRLISISRAVDNSIHLLVFVGLDLTVAGWQSNIDRNCKIVAEALIQATTGSKLGFSHDHSMVSELLAVTDIEDEEFSLPEGCKRQLEISWSDRAKVVKHGHKTILRHILLGIECDTEWENLPEDIRHILLQRCRGEVCNVSGDQLSRLGSVICSQGSSEIDRHIARSNLLVKFTTLINSFAKALEAEKFRMEGPEPQISNYAHFAGSSSHLHTNYSETRLSYLLKLPFTRINQSFRVCMKFLVVTLVADPEFQRELDFLMTGKLWIIRWPVTFLLNAIWLFCKMLQTLILPVVLLHGNKEVSELYHGMKGVTTVMEKQRIFVESLNGPSTCFLKTQADGGRRLHQYSGNLTQEPTNGDKLMAINTYDEKLVLRRREEYAKQSLVGSFSYEYAGSRSPKLPIQRQCTQGTLDRQIVQYDERGYITSGSYFKDGNLVEFKFFYRKNAKFDDELLRAEFTLAHIKMYVSWSVPPLKHPERLDKWLPHSKVMEATFIEGSQSYHSKWSYDHRSHPVIVTKLNGVLVSTPPMIQHDWFKILSKPQKCSFLADNPLLSFTSTSNNLIWRTLGLNKKRYRISTASARTHLWKSWKNSKNFDAVTIRWLDELAVRSDRVLKPYWRARDTGRLKAATAYLDSQGDAVMARTDIDPAVSSWTLLAYKFSDLRSFGQGGDATINTRTQSTQIRDTDDTLHVLAMDTGTWPNEGGGVSACRRDMVNDLTSIRWHVLAENANDFGLPKFQVEKNVQSLTVLPLWGLDFLTPTHGVFENYLDSAVQQKSHMTTEADIRKNFFPILTTLVKSARAINLTQEHLDEATKTLVDLNAYFESSRHWSDVWMSEAVKEKWRELWLTEDMENTRPISQWLQAEYPTIAHLDQALDMWQRYLFIFSIPVPETIPDVFQASHHFAGASYGVLCKVMRNCTLHVWDHCISWREVTVFLSSAMSFDPPFVCTSLISLSRVTCSLILTHADVVLPCADFFNPGWEVELGTLEGTIGHRNTFARKIDPVVNGISNMERFEPVKEIKSKLPTVSMLSHVRFVKDIKNAILAADIIVNEWKFDDYRLEIYGDMIKAPAYSVECQEIIAAKSLGEHVLLKGLGSPAKVLEDAWIFLNCSVSEGLPLAMGEAALTGVPVVCTDVGASFRVVTDPATGERFSAVVAPNDSLSLAQAQVKVLALLDEWSGFADDEDGYQAKLPLQPTKEEAKQITRRMYEKTEQRRRLGMMGRTNVLNSFSAERYLREHEQMLWIGKYRSSSYNARLEQEMSSKASRASKISTEQLLIEKPRADSP